MRCTLFSLKIVSTIIAEIFRREYVTYVVTLANFNLVGAINNVFEVINIQLLQRRDLQNNKGFTTQENQSCYTKEPIDFFGDIFNT